VRGTQETDADRERRQQVRLSKHKLLRHIFSHPAYEVSSAVVVALGVLLTGTDDVTSARSIAGMMHCHHVEAPPEENLTTSHNMTAIDPETTEAAIPQAEVEQNLVSVVFFVVFAVDFFLKAMTLGLEHAMVMGSVWGWIDVAVLVSMLVTVIQMASDAFGVSALPLRVVRLMRMLRPFAIIPRLKRVRHALESLWAARFHISRVSVLIFLMTFAASIAGLELFRCAKRAPGTLSKEP